MTLGASAPYTRVSRGALERNLRALDSNGAIDLRRDACGHGFDTVAAAAIAAGFSSARVDSQDVDRARTCGLDIVSSGEVDPDAVFGLAGHGEQVMSFVAPVLQTKPLRSGDGVSYGYRFRASHETNAALVSGGYAQGVVRAIGGQVSLRLAGREMPIVGRIAMDVCVVDTGDTPVATGDEATYFGPAVPGFLDDWARASALTPIEIVATIGAMNRREVVA